MAAMPEMHELNVGDARLAVLVEGEGPLIVAAHGFPDCQRSFRHQVAPLVAAGLRIAQVAMRGYAPSSASSVGRYDVGVLAGDLVAVADALSPASPVGLLGHDWGAVASYAAAALRPERFSGIATLAVPHLRVALPRFFTLEQLRRSFYMVEFQRSSAAGALRARDFAEVDALWHRWSPGYEAPADERAAVKAALGPHLEATLGYYRALRRPDRQTLSLLFKKTAIPAIYLHGRTDGCIGASLVRGVEKAYTGSCEVVVIERAGHFLHQERPDAVNAHLIPFFERVLDPGGAKSALGTKPSRQPAS